MATATIEGPGETASERVEVRLAPRQRRLRFRAAVASGGAAALLLGLGGYGAVQADDGSNAARGFDAWSQRLEGAADAYFAEQATIARGQAADAARLEAAADAFAARAG